MNAPALNPAASPATSSVGSSGAGGVAGAAGNPLAGFEALLSALFPVGGATGATPVSGQIGSLKSEDADVAGPEDGVLDLLGASDEQLSGDANAALLAGALAGQPLIALNTTPVAETGGAFSQDKSGGVASTPPAFGVDLEDTAEAANDLPERSDINSASAQNAAALRTDAPPPPAAPGVRAAAAASSPASDLPDPALAQQPPASADAASTDATPPPPVASATTPPHSAAGPGGRTEPVAARTARTDRSRSANDIRASDVTRPSPDGDAIATTVTAKPVAGASAARSPGEGLEQAESADRDSESVADAPDATLQAETRTAAGSLTPAALTAHGVRGSPETVATLAAQIIKKLEGQSTRFDLELNPAGLGKVDVRIDIGAHGRVSAAMMFDNPQAAADLRARASELQRILEQAGFDMSGGLSFDVAGDRGQQRHQAWQDQNDNAGHAFRGQAFRAALDTAGNATDAAIGGALRLRHGVNAGLDLRI